MRSLFILAILVVLSAPAFGYAVWFGPQAGVPATIASVA